MAGDELDELYGVRPEEFTALRSRLAAAAKKRGDAAAAKEISSARKPTTAAWMVNLLAHTNDDAKRSLIELGERLRAAHAAMDGAAIRELSSEQRSLVDELTRAAIEGAEMTNPSATLREDVTATLQAAIADPDVADRLGRLAKAEQWSGFGDFGTTTTVATTARGGKAKDKATPDTDRRTFLTSRKNTQISTGKERSRQQSAEARQALAAAERARDDADNEMSDRQTDL
ncbi:hypothetical protein A5662_02045, partial [Mycobacteriaceae bacterium 1482268.1]